MESIPTAESIPSWHRFRGDGSGLEQGIPCSTLALGWTWFRGLLDEKPMPRLKINILWSMGRPYSNPISRSQFHPSISFKNLASDGFLLMLNWFYLRRGHQQWTLIFLQLVNWTIVIFNGLLHKNIAITNYTAVSQHFKIDLLKWKI